MITITRWKNLVNTNGQTTETTWPEVFAWLSRRQSFRGTEKHPGWSPAEFSPPKRGLENVQRVFALCLDYDGDETIDDVRERLRGLSGLLHTTRKHTPEAPRFRVVLPLSRPVSPFEFEALWVRFAEKAGSIDEAPKDPSRFWFAPGCADDSEFVAEELTGDLLNPDEWLKKPDPSARVDDYQPAPRPRTDTYTRASAYIAKMPPSYEGQGGDRALWDAAVMAAKGFSLSESDTYGILREFNQRCEPPWPDRRLAYKASQAVRANLPDGFKLETDREWEPRRYPEPLAPEPPPEPDDWTNDSNDWQTQALEPEELGEELPRKSAVEIYGVVSLQQMFAEVAEVAASGKPRKGLTSGNQRIDDLIGGYRVGHVTVMGAGTSWGKSTFSIMAADENDMRGEHVLVVAGEDERIMYAQRFLARRGKMNALNLRDNDLDKGEIAKVIELSGQASTRPIFLRAIGMPVERICKAIRDLAKELPIKLVIADYVQRFKTERHLDRRSQVSYIGERLSDEIKNANAAGLVLSQLKRIEGRRPEMEDLKESGDLENIAEHILLGYREKDPENSRPGHEVFKRRIIVAKNKDGPIPPYDIEVPFNEVSASFERESHPSDAYIDDLAQPYPMPDMESPTPWNERGERQL